VIRAGFGRSRRNIVAVSVTVVAATAAGFGANQAVADGSRELQKRGLWSGRIVTRTARPSAGGVNILTRSDQLAAAVDFVVLHKVDAHKPEPDDAIPDGNEYVASRLVSAVITRFGAVPSTRGPVETAEVNAGPISTAAAGSDLVIDVRDGAVTLAEHKAGAHKDNFSVQFTARVMVYDVRARTRLADQYCLQTDRTGAPRDVLLADGDAALKERLRALWDECVARIETGMFGFEPDETMRSKDPAR
jgi:hypothetical protein